MKKGTRIVKRVLALFLVVLMSINTLGAVVSDNDGSAFITKAEFDSLKNDFQSQIDQYNTSIDSKIDGAIASYLAGIDVAKTTTKSLLVKAWNEGVIAINGSISNTFELPDVSGSLGLFQESHTNGMTGINVGVNRNSTAGTVGTSVGDSNGKICWMQGTFSYNNTKDTHKRVLVDNVKVGPTINVDKMTWAGIANNVTEMWTLSKLVRFATNIPGVTNTSHDPGYLENRFNISFIISTMLNLSAPGYVSTFVSATSPLWNPSVRWLVMNGSSRQYVNNWGSGECLSVSSIPTVNYSEDNEGNTYSYQHILNYKNDTSWEVAVKNETKYLSFSDNNTLRTDDWVSTLLTNGTVNGSWTGTELERTMVNRSTERGSTWVCGWINEGAVTFSDNKSDGSSNEAKIPVLGLLGSYQANQIYQYEKGDIIDEDSTKLEPVYLYQGLPIMQVKEDEIIEWEPTFKDISVDGVTGVNECKLILSYVPFANKTSLTNADDYVKMDGIAKGSFATTSSKKVKIKFEADRNSYVYAKWVPNTTDSTIDNSHWEVTLDIENSSTYKSTKE